MNKFHLQLDLNMRQAKYHLRGSLSCLPLSANTPRSHWNAAQGWWSFRMGGRGLHRRNKNQAMESLPKTSGHATIPAPHYWAFVLTEVSQSTSQAALEDSFPNPCKHFFFISCFFKEHKELSYNPKGKTGTLTSFVTRAAHWTEPQPCSFDCQV